MKIKKYETGKQWFDDGTCEHDPDFKSSVFANKFELLSAYSPLRRNPYRTMVAINGIMVEIDRQKEQTEMILRQQAEAIVSIEKHYAEGGSELMLEIPDWTSKQDTRINRH